MSHYAEIFTFPGARPKEGSVAIPYKGYEVSMTTVGRHGEVVVFPSRDSAEALASYYGATAASLMMAFAWIDENPKKEPSE